jgi:hypothetical protein
MLKKGQGFYRFKFEDFGSDLKVTKHFFSVVCVKETEFGTIWYRFKCEENPEVKYKDGLECSFDESLYGTVKPAGSAIYVILKDDDQEQAVQLVKEHLENRIAKIMKNLESAQSELASVEAYEACNSGLSTTLR